MHATLLRIPMMDGRVQNMFIESKAAIDDNGEFHGNYMTQKTVDNQLQVINQGRPMMLRISHEEFHKDLRKQAAEKGHLITSHCTDPEWNPEGYTKTLEEALNESQQTSKVHSPDLPDNEDTTGKTPPSNS